MTKFSLLSFDVFRTLLDIEEHKDRPEAFVLLARFLAYHGVVTEPKSLHQSITDLTNASLASNPSPTPDVDMLDILARVLGPQTDFSLLTQAALVLRAATTRLSPVPGAQASVAQLAGRLPLAICSNTQRAYTIGELRAFGFLPHFGTIVFSSDVLACKPDPAMFHRLSALTGTDPAHIIHIGDNLVDDIIAAKAVGCTTIWVDRHHDAARSDLDHSAADAIIGPDLANLPAAIAQFLA